MFKNDDRREVRNYRPVTVLPAVDKIYEKLLSKQIPGYMEPKLSHSRLTERTMDVKVPFYGLWRSGKKTWMAKTLWESYRQT